MLNRRAFLLSIIASLSFGLPAAKAWATKKHTTEVVVYMNGKLSKGRKVSLQFVGGLFSGGFTDKVYTNSDGVARIPHASTGKVKVYVDGNHSKHKTTGKAPGRIIVYLSK